MVNFGLICVVFCYRNVSLKKPQKLCETTRIKDGFPSNILVSQKKTFFQNPRVNRHFVSQNLASFQNLDS